MARKWLNVAFVLLTCAVLVAGCSSEKTANKANFKKAIVEWQQQNGGYLAGTKTLPASVVAARVPRLIARNFAMLSRAGLVDVVLDENAKGSDGVAQPQYEYSLTESGKKYYTPGKGFRVAIPQLVEVTDFTPPTNGPGGAKTTTVRFKYKNIPTELGKLVNPEAKEELYDGAAQLVLTENGWKSSVTAD